MCSGEGPGSSNLEPAPLELLLRGLMENNRVYLQNTEHTAILPKVGPAACHSEGNEEARLVERKVCFISEAGSKEGLGTGMLVFISRSWYELTSSFLLEIVFFFGGKNSGGKKKGFYQSSFLWLNMQKESVLEFQKSFIHLNHYFSEFEEELKWNFSFFKRQQEYQSHKMEYRLT